MYDEIEEYRDFCSKEDRIPIFLQPWWMDTVCVNGKWDVILYKENSQIKGVLVYYIVKKFIFKIIVQPPLTQYNGIWIKYDGDLSENDKIHFEKKICFFLISELEKIKVDYYCQNFNLNFKNWLPFYWNKFSQTTRYTYRINNISNIENCFQRFSYAKQKQIKKAQQSLYIKEITSEDFYELLKKNHSGKNQKVFYSKSFFSQLHLKSLDQNQGKIIALADDNNNIHASLFVVWDKISAYNLISAINPDFKSSGGSTLVVYEAIKYVSDKVNIFDFEGSMDKGIENSFSQFGTEQIPFFNIYKFNSKIMKFYTDILKKWH